LLGSTTTAAVARTYAEEATIGTGTLQADITAADVTRARDTGARITEEELVRATTTQALAGRVGKITSVMNSNSAAITTEVVTRANADSALAAQITTVEAQTNSNTAAITAETIARTTADSALSAQITTVDAKANDATANGFYRLTATANTNGAVAEFAVQLRATSTGSYADAGMHIQAFSGGNRRVKFYTDQFIVTTGPDAYQPFAISGGNVYANDLIVGNANIENAAITTAKIDDAQVTTLKVGSNAITVPTSFTFGPTIYGNGSFFYLSHGYYKPKGFWRYTVKDDSFTAEFVVNTLAPRFVNLDCRGLAVEESMQKLNVLLNEHDWLVGSSIRLHAEKDNLILGQVGALKRAYNVIRWETKQESPMKSSKEEKLEEGDKQFIAIEISPKTIKPLLMDRLSKRNLTADIIQRASAIMDAMAT